MASERRVFANLYRDSVSLMQLAATLLRLPGIDQASAVMASAANLDLLREAGLLGDDDAVGYGAGDLLIAVSGEPAALAAALDEAEALLSRAPGAAGEAPAAARLQPRSIEMALGALPAANLALISTPGPFAAAEAAKALSLGLNVMLFSDNVPLADEIGLKRRAAGQGLMVMGPDCGTAIIDGVPLGFANVVRRGDIGVVAASGTGLQQVTCLVDRWGGGISQAIGTGGRDLKAEVGGATMLQGLEVLAGDPATRVIVLVSKPPARAVADRVLARAAEAGKPVVVNFLGTEAAVPGGDLHAALTLEDAAAAAVALAAGRTPDVDASEAADAAAAAITALSPGQRYVRGLYTGGTFCYEALLLLRAALGPAWSNTPLDPAQALDDPWQSREHTVVDLGDDAFTRGRPHPMIDGTIRNERIVAEAADPEVAVILLDLVLGYGAHDDPAAGLAEAVAAARAQAAGQDRRPAFVASVCGTAGDPQGLAHQEDRLREAGVLLAGSNAAAVRLAARIAGHGTAQPAAGRRAEGGT